jgi:Tfp pilus assembly protein PilV
MALVEVLLATLLVGMTAIPLYDMFTTSYRGAASTVDRTRAVGFASELAEVIKAVPYEALGVTEPVDGPGWRDDQVADHMVTAPGQLSTNLADLGTVIDPLTGREENFERFLLIRPVSQRGDGSGQGHVKHCEVVVRWKEPRARRQEVSELKLVFLTTPRRRGVP